MMRTSRKRVLLLWGNVVASNTCGYTCKYNVINNFLFVSFFIGRCPALLRNASFDFLKF